MDLCRTVILTDEPEQNDAFSGPHQRIADAIAGLIQPPDAKAISIGIEGSWGSGKSTVARLLTKKLEADKNIAVVTFDAWAHEGDPLRRTFLETIIRKLQHLRWVNRRYWNNRIEQLANRREVVKTKDSLKITRSGKAIAFMLLLVPIGGAFINAALREGVTVSSWPPAFKFSLLFLIGLALTFTPLLVLLSKIKNEPDILGVLFNKGPTEKTTETSKTVNPTSIEFEDNFRKLFKHALAGPKNSQRRIVLILDNLDRVDAQDALSIWSTLQTFLQHKGTSRPSWHERVWLLVLYDLQGLSQLRESAENKAGGKTASSFIDKSFQIRFEVPALVPSDWSTFLIDQLKRAFPDHSESDWHEVYRALAISVEKGNKVPTIRELKLFVNQIGAIHRQWAACDTRQVDTFPLSHIACYVLLRREEDVIKELFNPGFPQKEYQDLLGSAVRENLAGLAFNVEVDVAQQLLFSDKIKGALLKRTDEDLKTVASLLRRGFWQTFEQIATTQWAFTEASNMAEAALSLEESGVLITASRPSAKLITKTFCDAASTVQAWSPMDHEKANGLAVLIKWDEEWQGNFARHEQFIEKLFKAIALGLNDHAMRTDLTLNAMDWLDCVSVIAQKLDLSMKQKALKIVFDTLSDQLRLPDPLQPKQSAAILEILSELQEMPDVEVSTGKALKDLADEGRVAAQFREDISTHPGAVAWIAYVLIRYSSEFKKFPWRGERSEQRQAEVRALFSESMVQTFVEILARFKQTALLFKMSKNDPRLNSLVAPSLRLALESPEAHKLFTTEDRVQRLEFVFERLRYHEKDSLLTTRLFSELYPQLNLVNELPSRTFKASNASLYLLVLQSDDGEQGEFVSWCIEGLRAIGSDWSTYLYDSEPLALAFQLKRLGVEVELGEQYSLALRKRMEAHKSDTWTPSPNENLAALIGPLESEFRIDFLDYLCNLIKGEDQWPVWLFYLFGQELSSQLLCSHGLRVVELLPFVLNSNRETALNWLRDTVRENAKSLESKYGNDAEWSNFKLVVRQALAAEQDEKYPLVKNIASILHVRLLTNGLIAFATTDETEIFTLNSSFETERLIKEPLPGNKFVSDPSWSPDGEKLAYTGAVVPSDYSQIFILDCASGSTTLVTEVLERSRQPRWSPDGHTLAFVRIDESQRHIFTINLHTKKEQRLTKGHDKNEWPNWSPDGSKLAFHRISDDGVRIFVMNSDGSDERAITSGARDYDPSWSPGGMQIAFARWAQRVEDSGIYIVNPTGTQLVQFIQENDARAPAWSPDGAKLIFQVGHGSGACIYQVDADGQNKKELTKGISPSWQPILDDGRMREVQPEPHQTPKS